MPDACENCGEVIGKLETAHLHHDHIVCVRCWTRLNNASVEGTPAPSPGASSDSASFSRTPARQKPADVAKAGKVMALIGLGIGLLGVAGGNPGADSAGFVIMLIGIVVWAIGSARESGV